MTIGKTPYVGNLICRRREIDVVYTSRHPPAAAVLVLPDGCKRPDLLDGGRYP